MKSSPFAVVLLVIAGTLGSSLAQSGEKGYASAIKSTLLLRTDQTATGQPIAYPQINDPEVTAVYVEIPPGAETGWHSHPFPSYGYILSGHLSVESEDGKVASYMSGQALVEMVNMSHNGRNTGTEPVTLVMFVTGEKDKPFTVRDTSHPVKTAP